MLQRDFDGYFNNVAGDRYPFTSPSAGIWGPKVMIINEMAGSGGDLMPWMFRHRKIGLLVGKRTWGGLVHTADTPPFIDGGSMIAPRGGFFTREGKWAVENEGDGARHRRGELAEGSDRRTRSATRARRPGGDAAIEGTPGQSYVHRTAAADVGDAERANARTGDDRWKRKRSAISRHNTTGQVSVPAVGSTTLDSAPSPSGDRYAPRPRGDCSDLTRSLIGREWKQTNGLGRGAGRRKLVHINDPFNLSGVGGFYGVRSRRGGRFIATRV